MEDKKEYQIEEIFERNGKKYKCVEEIACNSCNGCAFECEPCIDLACDDVNRGDKNNVIFVEVEPDKQEDGNKSDSEYDKSGCVYNRPISHVGCNKQKSIRDLEEDYENQKQALEDKRLALATAKRIYANEVFDRVWNELLEYFHWGDVVTMMNSIGWQWAFVNEKDHRPLTIEDVQQQVYDNISSLIHRNIEENADIHYTESGGFRIVYRDGKEVAEMEGFGSERGVWPSVELIFVGDSWTTSPLSDDDPAMQD